MLHRLVHVDNALNTNTVPGINPRFGFAWRIARLVAMSAVLSRRHQTTEGVVFLRRMSSVRVGMAVMLLLMTRAAFGQGSAIVGEVR